MDAVNRKVSLTNIINNAQLERRCLALLPTLHILSLLSFGNGNRTQHATDANSESSRSHAVLQVFLKMKDKDAGLSAEVRVAKMSLIDLAGSEKGGVTGNKGAR